MGSSYKTQPCKASVFDMAQATAYYPDLIRMPEYGRFTWLQLSLTEGKYHQVRKMVNVVGHKCIRLIRTSIEDITLGPLAPGEVKEMDEVSFFKQLRIPYED
jgi:23S rRNA pseudouridine2457 synthase